MTTTELSELVVRYGGSTTIGELLRLEALREAGGCTCARPGETGECDHDCEACRAADRAVFAADVTYWRRR